MVETKRDSAGQNRQLMCSAYRSTSDTGEENGQLMLHCFRVSKGRNSHLERYGGSRKQHPTPVKTLTQAITKNKRVFVVGHTSIRGRINEHSRIGGKIKVYR